VNIILVMNKLSLEARAQILSMLVEGMSMRAVSRLAGVSINTVTKLLIDAGEAAAAYHDITVKGLTVKQLQCDEIWAFCQAKKSNVARMKKPSIEAGDVWTFTALDADTKLIVTWFSGDRDYRNTRAFLNDAATRIVSPVQVSTDGFSAYRTEMSDAFGWDASFATIQKNYTGTPDMGPSKKYSPGTIVSQTKDVVFGAPDMAKASTSYVERQNLNIRLDNHSHSLAIYFFHHNFCRIVKSLRVTPAMQAGVSDTLMTMKDLVQLVDMMAEPPKPRGPYKKRLPAG
jgi:IS1 family transposase